MSKQDRKRGFYWVRHATPAWEVAEWNGAQWLLTGSDAAMNERQIAEIDERRIERTP